MKVTLIRTDKHNESHLTTRTLEDFLERIKSDTVKGDAERLRTFGIKPPKGTWAEIYASAEMRKEKNGRLAVVTPNGIVALTVDQLKSESDCQAVKTAAAMLPMTLAAFTGTDGHNVVVLVRVSLPEGRLPETEEALDSFYQKAYDVAFATYSGVLPYPIRRESYAVESHFTRPFDPQPFCHAEATPLVVNERFALSAEASSPKSEEQRSIDMDRYAEYEQMYARALSELSADDDTTAGLTELAHRLCTMGMPQEEAFLHIHHHHVFRQDYDADTARVVVDAAYAKTKPRKKEAKDHTAQSTRELIDFLQTRYVFRYNTLAGYAEYRPNNTWVQDWRPCDEKTTNSMTIEAKLAGIDVRDKDVRRYVNSNFIRNVNPIDDYLWEVHDKWDGKTDHIGMLARTVPCDCKEWEGWFRRWFLYMVAQWRGERFIRKYGNSTVPLLVSKQGNNKSTFCRSLLPPELQWGYIDNLLVEEKRQTLQAMHNFLLINLDEFNQISPRIQQGFLKNIIQLPTVKMKRPYGKRVEDFPRRASFIATCNEASVLADPSGSRRFIGIQLTGAIDISYKPNYEGLYAQACALLDQGERYWFDAEETKQIMAHNRKFEQVPAAMQFFLDHFEPCDNEQEGTWLTTTAIFTRLKKLLGSTMTTTNVVTFGKYLANLPDIKTRRSNAGMLYLVREKA